MQNGKRVEEKQEITSDKWMWCVNQTDNFGHYAMILYLLIKNEKLKTIVEIGVNDGFSTKYMLKAAAESDARVYSVDIKDCRNVVNNILRKWWYFKKSDSSDYGLSWRKKNIDLLFVDGDHSYAGVMNDLSSWYPNVVKGGYIIMHDCLPGSDVEAAMDNFFGQKEELRETEKIVITSLGLAIIRKLADV